MDTLREQIAKLVAGTPMEGSLTGDALVATLTAALVIAVLIIAVYQLLAWASRKLLR